MSNISNRISHIIAKSITEAISQENDTYYQYLNYIKDKKYKNSQELIKNDKSLYYKLYRLNLLPRLYNDLNWTGKFKLKITLDDVMNAAYDCFDLSDFKKRYNNYYSWLYNNKMLDEFKEMMMWNDEDNNTDDEITDTQQLQEPTIYDKIENIINEYINPNSNKTYSQSLIKEITEKIAEELNIDDISQMVSEFLNDNNILCLFVSPLWNLLEEFHKSNSIYSILYAYRIPKLIYYDIFQNDIPLRYVNNNDLQKVFIKYIKYMLYKLLK